MDFDHTFQALSADATKLATPLCKLGGKGAPSLEVGTGRGRAVISVFASSRDVDPDAIFGPKAAEGAQPASLLSPTPGQAWLKLQLQGDAANTLRSTPLHGNFQLKGTARSGLGAYFPSPDSRTLSEALRQAGAFPDVLDDSDVRGLAPGHVAFLAMAGTLSARLEFKWADVLTGEITPLRGLVAGDRPLDLAVDFKAGLTVAIAIADSFQLAFAGVDSDYVAVSLNRASSGSLSVRAGATATVRLENPDLARGLLADLCAQLLGVPPERSSAARDQLEALVHFYDNAIQAVRDGLAGVAARIDALLDAEGLPLLLTRLQQLQAIFRLTGGAAPEPGGLSLSIEEMTKAATLLDGLATGLAGKIGTQLDDMLASLKLPALAKDATGAARGLLEHIEKLERALSLMARKRIERGVAFEYRRIATGATVFKARLRRNHRDFAAWHRALVGLDATAVLNASSPANLDVLLDLFLNQKSVKRSVSLGLNLGRFYSDTDSAHSQWTESTRKIADARAGARVEHRLALMGSRSREEKVLGTHARCSGQFDAAFATQASDGRLGRWSFELALAYASGTPEADLRWLQALADYACVWGVITDKDFDWLVRTLESDGAIGAKVEMEVALTVHRSAFADKGFLQAFGKVSDSDAAGALAAALQRMEQFPERASPGSRRAAYAGAMHVLLGKQGIDVSRADAVARFVGRNLEGASRELKAFESIGARPIGPGSVAWIAQHSGSAMAALRQFREASALGQLVGADCQGSSAERKIASTAFNGFDLAWRDRFLLRWQVCMLRNIASQVGAAAATTSTLKVTVGASGKTRIITSAR